MGRRRNNLCQTFRRRKGALARQIIDGADEVTISGEPIRVGAFTPSTDSPLMPIRPSLWLGGAAPIPSAIA
jgi:hypothetical protein